MRNNNRCGGYGVPLGTAANYFRTRDELLGAFDERIFERLAPAPERLAELAAQRRNLPSFTEHLRDIVHRTTEAPDLKLALLELRLESTRRPGLAAILRETLERNYRADVESGVPRPRGAWIHHHGGLGYRNRHGHGRRSGGRRGQNCEVAPTSAVRLVRSLGVRATRED